MPYVGQTLEVPLGRLGLVTDLSQRDIPLGALTRADNVQLDGTNVVKSPGSAKFNTTALDSAIVALFDWFPTFEKQRLIAATASGKLYRDSGDRTFNGGTAIKSDLTSLNNQVMFVEGGAEEPGNPKKLFFFNSGNQVQVLTGDGTTFVDMKKPAADWTNGNFPTAALVFDNSLTAFGNRNAPHRLYLSNVTDHEDFQSVADIKTFQVFPGEGQRIVATLVYNGKLFIFKDSGVYVLDNRDAVGVTKLKGSFGCASAHSPLGVLNDVLLKNETGSITSVVATDKFGDIEAGDVLRTLSNEDFMRKNTNPQGTARTHAIYYPDKKRVLVTYQSKFANTNDRLLTLDFQAERPRVTWEAQKDDVNCLILQRDSKGVPRPIYGNTDGFVFLYDQDLRSVDGTAYNGVIETADIDFGQQNAILASQVKNFDFLELIFEPEGRWNVTADIFVDGHLRQTLTFLQLQENGLAGATPKATDFVLDASASDHKNHLLGDTPEATRKRFTCGQGKRIRIRLSNSVADQRFTNSSLIISYRIADESARRI